MRAREVLLAIAALALQGCDPLVGGCHDADIPAVVPIRLERDLDRQGARRGLHAV